MKEEISIKIVNNSNNESFVYKEGAWGWIVVLSASYCLGILIGMINNYALIYNKLIAVYSDTDHHVFYAGWIGSLANGLQFLLCIFGSILVDLYNPRKIGIAGGLISAASLIASAFIYDLRLYFITYSVFLSIGQAILLSSTFAILPHYFSKKLSLANGLMNALASVIVVLLPICISSILRSRNLSEAFLFLAFLNIIASLSSITYIAQLPMNNDQVSMLVKVKQSFGLRILRIPRYVLWCIASLIAMFGYLIPIITINHHSQTNFPEYDSVYLNVAFGGAGGVSSIIFGILGDYIKFAHVHYHTVLYLIYGIVQMTIPLAPSFMALVVQISILGIMDGIFLCFIVPICCDFVDSKLSNQAVGYFHAIIAPTCMLGTPLAAKLYEINGNYTLAFQVGAIFCVVGSMILFCGILIPDVFRKTKSVINKHKIKDINLAPLEINA